MTQPAVKHLTEAEYLAFEREPQGLHELCKGEIFLMSDASFKHNIIEDNIRGALHAFLKGKKCRSSGSNLLIHVPLNSFTLIPMF